MKAILLVDMPDNCRACRYKCFEASLRDKYRPYWCPLKPMPSKKKEEPVGGLFAKGWNKCLEEITGETE